MALARKFQKIFGGTADVNEIGVFGSKQAGSAQTSKDIDTIQSLTAWGEGMRAGTSASLAPYLQDHNAVFYVATAQLAYLFQAGIAEWESQTEYVANRSVVLRNGKIYIAKANSTNVEPETGLNWRNYWICLTDWGNTIGNIYDQTDLWNILLKGISFDNTVSTAINGYPKYTRVLYTDEKYKRYYVESLKDNNTSAPNNENIYFMISAEGVEDVVDSTDELPVASSSNVGQIYLSSSGTQIYICIYQGGAYSWSTLSASGLNHQKGQVVYDKTNKNYYIYDNDSSSWVRMDNSYDWIYNSQRIPMPDYSAGISINADTIYRATKDLYVIVNIYTHSDDNTPGKFYISDTVDGTPNIVCGNFGLNGARGWGSWSFLIPKGYLYKIEKNAVDEIDAKIYPMI